jgi:hypothetical protein
MPALPLQCPLCAGVLQIDTAWAGQQVACPLCRGVITVPPMAVLNAVVACDGGQPPLPTDDRFPPQRPAKPVELASRVTNAELVPTPSRQQQAISEASAMDLLPPGAGQTFVSAAYSRQAGMPAPLVPPAAPATAMMLPPAAPASPIVSPEDNRIAVQDRPRVVGSGGRQVEVRRLSAEEKAQRRLRKNLILFGFCILVLVVVFYFLTR